MSLTQPNLVIEIDEEEYRLDVVPAAESKVVAAEKEKLLGAVNLKTLVDDLGRVGRFIRIAYNGVGAAGAKYTKLQIEIQDLGYDVTRLCDQSALTVSKFKKASATVLTDLQATYGYLLDNLEDLAVETLSAVSKIAGDMETAALELHSEFKKEEEKVINTLKNTQIAKGEEKLLMEKKKMEREQLERDQKHQEQLMNDAQRLEREAEAERHQSEMKEDEAINSIKHPGPLKAIVNGLFKSEVFDQGGSAEKRAEHWKRKRIEALQKENECRKRRYEALEKMTNFAAKLKQCQTQESMADAAEKALHEAVGALKELSAVMMQAAQFWKQMQEHCRSLADDQMKTTVEKAMKYPEEKRLKVWTSKSFKMKAIQFYAGWVALNSVCSVYVEHIKLTQKDLYEYLRENPTYEESKQNVHKLADQFLTDLKKDQKAIAEKEFATQAEIKALNED